ncbi:MAG: S9 family peptidase [Verrucomicrobiales bacterium]|nr:S9 family peptidase [Verrucomicrobiales bacterium]
MMTSTTARLFSVFTALAASVTALAGPPVAPVRPVTDTYFGTPVTDNYRYLEDLKSPEVQAWMRGQADHTRAQLDSIPGRKALLDRIHELANADSRSRNHIQRGQRWFYLRRERGAQQPRLFYRDGLSGEEHVLLDPATMDAGAETHYALDYFVPSWDGKRLAYGLSKGGSEASVLHVLEVDTGTRLAEAIDRTHFGRIAWLPDSASFYYMRYNEPTPQMSAAERLYNARTYWHRLGSNPAGDGDAVVFGRGVDPSIDVPEGQGAFLITAPDSPYAVALANHNLDDNPSTFYVAPLAAIKGAPTPWKRFAEVRDGITAIGLRGDTLFYLTSDGAPRFKLMATSLSNPDVHQARTVVPQDQGVLTDFSIAADGIYYRIREGMGATLHRVGFDGQGPLDVSLPFVGTLVGPITDPGQLGALYNLQDFSRAPQLYTFDPATGQSRNTGLLPTSKIDSSMLATEHVLVTSWDGTRVPLTIVHGKDLEKGGRAPTLIIGYGSYGVSSEPVFVPTFGAWLERGGVLAFAHVRGGGELGEDWHKGGFKRNKSNSWLDFIACSEHLVDHGYTVKGRLAGAGTSAGGILIGNAMSERPDLYRVIIDSVGLSDMLRMETEPNGPPNVSEFGSVKEEEGFHSLYGMSAYAHVRDGLAYPAIMFTTGANDNRVAPWHMMKMAARTQAATRSGYPVLLRIDFDAGHGSGSNLSQAEQQLADVWSFALWQMGDPAFQPTLQ